MKIILNGEETVISETPNVTAFLAEAGYADMLVAVAVNGAFVPRSSYESTCLTANDSVEIVAPMQGG